MLQNDAPVDSRQLTTVYKRSGAFDQQRKQLLDDFKKSETHKNLLLKLQTMVDNKVKNDPSILAKNRGKMAALLQGEIVSQHSAGHEAGLLAVVDKDIQEKIIELAEFRKTIQDEIRDIRRKLMGVSDEEYQKQLDEEAAREIKLKDEAEGWATGARDERDRDLAYKNNFKVKKAAHRVSKVPQIKFAPRGDEEKKLHQLMY